jgi:hypothetical protein
VYSPSLRINVEKEWLMKNFVRNTMGRSLVVVVLTLLGLAAPAFANQVPFTATGTVVITAVTNLPGGLTQLDGFVTGTASHLGNTSGPISRIQDHQGNFDTTTVLVSANGNDSVFLAVSGKFDKAHGGQCVLTSTGTYTVTGGTGSFANATGSGIIVSEIDLCAGTATGTYTGTISQPNSN